MDDGFAFGYSGDADVQEAADDGADDENNKANMILSHRRKCSCAYGSPTAAPSGYVRRTAGANQR